jgi:threonine dehydratase
MLGSQPTPLIRLGGLFPRDEVYARCEFLGASGSFKIRGAAHLLRHLIQADGPRSLVVPSMGNTALGAAAAARELGFGMTAVVPVGISRAKDEKLRALGVEVHKVDGGGSDLLLRADKLARQRGAYFVHPHLDPLWTDGYQSIAAELLAQLPACRAIVFPLGGGGLLMGLAAFLRNNPAPVRLIACEPYNYPKYARFTHPRSPTIADGLILELPHPAVQQVIAEAGVEVGLVPEEEIRAALAALYDTQGLVVEPSSAVPLAFIRARGSELPQPVCVLLTGENVTREDHRRLISRE